MTNRTLQLFESAVILFEEVLAEIHYGKPPKPPEALFHYSSLETLQKCIQTADVRLSHAEYSNDARELTQARDLILAEIERQIRNYAVQTAFYGALRDMLVKRLEDLDVYIFCMCEGAGTTGSDILSQWRAYGRDGRGGAMAIRSAAVQAMVVHFPGIRIEKVIYDETNQVKLIQKVLEKAYARYRNSSRRELLLEETTEVLSYCIPLMKHAGFQEEREWRLFYLPVKDGKRPHIQFHPRRDFLAPFVTLRHLWRDVRPFLAPEGRQRAQKLPQPDEDQLVQIEKVVVGPSTHQLLNLAAMKKVVESSVPPLSVEISNIPYRSVE
jgi:hypothetical protein